jgi:hypothetical protein
MQPQKTFFSSFSDDAFQALTPLLVVAADNVFHEGFTS